MLDPSVIRTRAFGTNYDSLLFSSFFPFSFRFDCFQIRERSGIWFRGWESVYSKLCTVNHEYHWSTGSCTGCFKAIAGKSARENLGYRPSGSFLPSYLRSIDYPRLGDQPIPAFSWHTTSLHFVRSMLLVHRTFALWNVLQIRSNSFPLFSFSFFLSLSFFFGKKIS